MFILGIKLELNRNGITEEIACNGEPDLPDFHTTKGSSGGKFDK